MLEDSLYLQARSGGNARAIFDEVEFAVLDNHVDSDLRGATPAWCQDSAICVVRDANMGHQLAGGNSSWRPELKSWITHWRSPVSRPTLERVGQRTPWIAVDSSLAMNTTTCTQPQSEVIRANMLKDISYLLHGLAMNTTTCTQPPDHGT